MMCFDPALTAQRVICGYVQHENGKLDKLEVPNL